ncbi:MAG: hypothetical protein HFJ80_04770 [Clostridiales bacterium]|nr:hypothetical protein [Clostridiales bacterium]
MTQDELLLYETFGNYATENLFWSLSFLNNAVFRTPMQAELKNKLFSMNKTYETIILSIYPEEGKHLVAAMAASNRLFVSYIEHLLQGDGQAAVYQERWRENGQRIAALLNQMNAYWKINEWSAMIRHEADLLEMIAMNMKDDHYTAFVSTAPLCRRLAIDMSKYMCSGITRQKLDGE